MKVTFQACIFTGSIIFLFSGFIALFVGEPIRDYIISKQFILTPDSNLFKSWQKSSEIPQEFYFFNWTNPEDIYNASVKPKFKQVGPYKYTQVFQKENIQWNTNGTVSFQQNKFWYFKNGALNDKINIVNPIILTAAHGVRYWGFFSQKGVSIPISLVSSSIHITKTVGQLLFEGYSDPVLQLKAAIPFIKQGEDKFGIFYKKNGSSTNGVFNLGTGVEKKFGKLYNWRYRNRTDFYKNHCGHLDRCLGDFFEPGLKKTKIEFFSADLCRIITMEFVGEEIVENVLGFKYAIGGYTLDNGTKYSETECFCGGECVPSGVFNISRCRSGAPFFISLPHFYKADPYYLEHIEGLRPNDSMEFSAIIEPITGVPLQIDVRFQANLMLQPVSGIQLFQDIPRRYFMPFMWNHYRVRIPSHKAVAVKFVIDVPQILMSVGIGLILVGLVLLLLMFGRMYWERRCVTKTNNTYLEQAVPLQKKHIIR